MKWIAGVIKLKAPGLTPMTADPRSSLLMPCPPPPQNGRLLPTSNTIRKLLPSLYMIGDWRDRRTGEETLNTAVLGYKALTSFWVRLANSESTRLGKTHHSLRELDVVRIVKDGTLIDELGVRLLQRRLALFSRGFALFTITTAFNLFSPFIRSGTQNWLQRRHYKFHIFQLEISLHGLLLWHLYFKWASSLLDYIQAMHFLLLISSSSLSNWYCINGRILVTATIILVRRRHLHSIKGRWMKRQLLNWNDRFLWCNTLLKNISYLILTGLLRARETLIYLAPSGCELARIILLQVVIQAMERSYMGLPLFKNSPTWMSS